VRERESIPHHHRNTPLFIERGVGGDFHPKILSPLSRPKNEIVNLLSAVCAGIHSKDDPEGQLRLVDGKS
jgi:hypothetical protein